MLVIFDVDGTLTRTTDVDARCFVRAAREVLGVALPADASWDAFRHTTDSGIARELVRRARGRPATPWHLARLRSRQQRLLERALRRRPTAFRAVRGARTLLARLTVDEHYAVALATGAWRWSARTKLAAARLDVAALPAAFADDGIARERIVRIAQARARRLYGVRFARVVLVGDAPWDARAARRLALPLVGVADKRGEGRLRAAGVRPVLRDFRDLGTVLRAFHAAEVPRPREGDRR